MNKGEAVDYSAKNSLKFHLQGRRLIVHSFIHPTCLLINMLKT